MEKEPINETFLDNVIRCNSKKSKKIKISHNSPDFDKAAKNFIKLLNRSLDLKPIKTAIVHPTDKDSLLGAIRAAQFEVITPILVGPKHKILAVAKECKANLDHYKIVDVHHSHEAAAKAVEMACKGEVSALMKGSIHTDELMSAVVKEKGLRTGRRMSHAFLMSVATFYKPFVITDAAINIRPNLEDKRDIVQNAVDLMRIISASNKEIKVAVLSAVETVTSAIPATLDAAALSKMADRDQIKHAIVDGPLAFDNAISLDAAEAKGIESQVSGNADILMVPDLESGNMLAKQLKYLGHALMAGIVLGAKVPIVLTSRADPIDMRVISCVLAAFIHYDKQEKLLSKK